MTKLLHRTTQLFAWIVLLLPAVLARVQTPRMGIRRSGLHCTYLTVMVAGLLMPALSKAQSIPAPAAICPGEIVTLLPVGLPGGVLSFSVTTPAGISLTSASSSGIVLATDPALTAGTYSVGVVVRLLGNPILTATVPVTVNGIPVLSLNSLTGSVLGSVLNLGSCSLGSTLSYTVSTGISTGTTGTGSLTLTPALAGQLLSVVCSGGPCPGSPTTIALPLPALQTLNLGNVPISVCVDAPISLTLLPTPGVDLSAVGLAVTASTTSGTLTVSALGPNGALTINGGQLTVGNNQPVTITVSLGGLTLASTTVNINIVQPAIPNQPLPGSLTATVGSVLSLSGLCPTGTLLNISNLANTTGIITIPTTVAGTQSLSILCNDNGCLSPVRVVDATVFPVLFNVLNNGPVCLGQPLSLTVLPGNFSLTDPLVSVSVSGPANLMVSALDPNGVLTITGLTSGVNNLSVVVSVAGTPVATVGVTVTANPVPDPVTTASLTVLEGTTVSLTALCPTAIVSTTGIGGTTVPLLSLPPTTVGVQVLPLLCATGSGSCVSPITSVTVITVPIPTIGLTPSALQVCINNPVSLTVTGLTLPFGLSVLGVSSAGVTITNNVITVTGLPAGPTTLTVNAGLTVAGIPVIAAQTITITVLDPAAPTVVTQGGQAYPAGVGSLSVTQNSPSVLFNASCSSGSLSYTSSTGATGTTSPITVPTTATGVVSYSAVCTNGACVSPATVVSVTVVAPAAPVNQNPVVVGGGIQDPQSATVGVPFSTTVSGAFSDPDGNPLTFTASNLPPGLSISPGGVISGTPTVSGPFVVTVTANDGQGGTVTDSFTLNVAPNAAPVVTTPGDQSLTINVPASFTVVATDPEGGTVTYAATGLPPSLTINPTTGVVTGTPSVTGTFPVVVTVTDPQGNTSSTGFNVVVNPAPVVNQAPVLSGTPLASPQNATVGIGFSTSTAQAFTDPEGQPLTFSVSGLPTGLAINPNTGVISGVPSVSGSFGVVVTATDSQGASVASGFTLNVAPAAAVNQPPVVVGGGLASPQNATVGVAFSTSTAQAFSDPDGDVLTYSAAGLPAGLSINAGTGIISGVPSVSGSFGIVVTANDGRGGSVNAGFTLNVAPATTPNQAPVLSGTPLASPQSATVGVAFSTSTAQAFTDPDGGPLTYAVSGLPGGLNINPTTGVISGAPSVSGNFGVTVTATDPQGASVSAGFTLSVVNANQAPVLTGNSLLNPQSATVGVAFSTTTAGAFTDPNGDVLTYSVTGLPAGLGINPTTGVISGVPSVSGSFGVTVTATDPQNASVSVNFTLNVAPATVPNQAPVLSGTPLASPQNATVGIGFSTSTAQAFTDPEGQPLTFSVSGLPNGVAINPTTGVISGAPSVSGTFGVVVTATDPQGASVASGFTLNVAPAATPVTNGPLAATVVSYNCATGAIVFGRVGGDPNRPVEYMAIGVRGYSTDVNAVIEAGLRADANQSTITVMARYVGDAGSQVNFVFNFRAFCAGTPPTNQPPTYTNGSLTNQTGTVGVPFSYGIPANAFVDPEGQPLTFTALNLPPGLSLTGSTISGTPSVSGVYGVTITATDPQGAAATGNFTITINPAAPGNQNPVVVGGGIQDPQSATVGVPFSTTVSGAFSDPDGNTLTFTASNLPPGLGITPGGVISGTPTVSGPFVVTVTANDGQGGTVTDSFTLNVSPAPVVGGPLAATVVSYNCQTGAIVFGRIGGDPNRVVEYMAIGVRGYSTDVNAVIEAGLRADANQSTITLMARYVGDAGSQVQFVFNFRSFCAGTPPTNQPPTYTNGSLTNQTGTVGVPFSYGIPANAFVDPEGQTLTFTALNLPPGLSLTGSTISGTPSVSGVYGVTITATDPQGAAATGNFTITINPAPVGNGAPIVAGTIPNQTATAGASYSYAIPAGTFTDPEGQTLTYSASGLPRGLGFSGMTFSGVPTQEGQFLITVTAFDPQGNFASTTFTLTVIPSNLCGSDPATFGQPLQVLEPTYNCQTGTIKFNVRGGNGSVIEFGAIGITPFQTNCFETMDTEVAQDVRDDKANVEPFQIMARQNGQQTTVYAFDARAYCRPGGTGNPNGSGRRSVLEPMAGLSVTVFGNPTAGEEVEVEVAGAEGKPLTLRVADGLGKVIGQQFTEKAGATQRYMVPVGKSAGIYFLQVSTPNQVQTVKIVRQ